MQNPLQILCYILQMVRQSYLLPGIACYVFSTVLYNLSWKPRQGRYNPLHIIAVLFWQL